MAVYVVGPVGGPYKIGTASSTEKRLPSLQTGSPVQLTIIMQGDGGRELETQLHEKFKYCLIRGEWFNLSEDNLRELEAILVQGGPDSGLEVQEQTVTIRQLYIGKKALTYKFIQQLPSADIREIGGVLWGWWKHERSSNDPREQIQFLFEKNGVLYRGSAPGPEATVFSFRRHGAPEENTPQPNRLTLEQWTNILASGQIFL